MDQQKTITLDELKAQVGGEPRYSRWYVLDQSRIDSFADATEDWQFIHCDKELAAKTPFGSTIAHGFLTLSMLSAMSFDCEPALENMEMGINYGFNRIRFTSPVKEGLRVRGKFITRAVDEKTPINILTTTGITVEIEGESRPAISAEWLGMTILKDKT